jgi:hypothetical protein
LVVFGLITHVLYGQVQPLAPPATPVKLFFEKVWVHTDRDYYLPSDDVWFKAYVVNAQSNMLSTISKNLTVQLISLGQVTIATHVLDVSNGTGNGDFQLSDSIPPGIYHLRAYTNWMLNFGSNFIFQKDIVIGSAPFKNVTTPKDLAQAHANSTVISGPPLSKPPVIHFYPEGGFLVDDVACLVAFKTEIPGATGAAVIASIVSSKGDTVNRIQSTSSGVGSFIFIPQANTTYHVTGTFNSSIPFTDTLPRAVRQGFVLHVSDADSAHLRVTISTNQATLNNYPNKTVTLTGRHTGQRFLNGPVKFEFLQINAILAKSQFPEGVSALTVYDDKLRPQSERLVYIERPAKATTIELTTDRAVYEPRQKVTVHIALQDSAHKPLQANLSMAAVDASLAPAGDTHIAAYLLFQSELRGYIANAAQYFNPANINRFKQIDLLLLTQGWRAYVWRRLADTSIRISYAPQAAFTVSGRLRQKLADKPLPGMNVLLTVQGEKLSAQYGAVTDAGGKFRFDNVRINGTQPITVGAFDQNKKGVGIVLLDTIARAPGVTAAFDNDTTRLKLYNDRLIQAFSADNPQLKQKAKMLKEVKISDHKTVTLRNITANTFGYPDQTFTITKKDEYFQTLDNWMMHNIKGAQQGDSEDSSGVYFFGVKKLPYGRPAHPGYYGKIMPVLIVNGKEVFLENSSRDVDLLKQDAIYNNSVVAPIYNLTVDKIKKVTFRHLVGNDDGITVDVYVIYLETVPNPFDSSDFFKVNTTVAGYYQARTFYEPVYPAKRSSVQPDYRTTLNWQPNIKTDAKGEATVSFYNSDAKTGVRVVVQGITANGTPLFKEIIYQIN